MSQPSGYEHLSAPEATSLLVINDWHENVALFERAFSRARAQGGKVGIVVSDILLHDQRLQAFRDLGLKDPSSIIKEYIAGKLPDEHRETYQIGQIVEQYGGLEAYVEAVRRQQPSVDTRALSSQLGAVYERYRSPLFQKTLEHTVANTTPQERQRLANEQVNAIASLELVNGYMDEVGLDRICAPLKEYEEDIAFIIVGSGNHDTRLQVQGLEERLQRKVYWSEQLAGTITAGDIKFQVVTNTGDLIPSSEALVYGPNVPQLYEHLLHDGYVRSDEEVKNISPATLAKSPTYQRLQSVDSLDLLISHFDQQQSERGVFPLPKDVGAYWAMDRLKPDAPVLSGHIHEAREGRNILGRRAVRQPGATLVTKQNGALLLETVAPFSSTEATYNILDMRARLAKELPDYLKAIQQMVAQQQKRAA